MSSQPPQYVPRPLSLEDSQVYVDGIAGGVIYWQNRGIERLSDSNNLKDVADALHSSDQIFRKTAQALLAGGITAGIAACASLMPSPMLAGALATASGVSINLLTDVVQEITTAIKPPSDADKYSPEQVADYVIDQIRGGDETILNLLSRLAQRIEKDESILKLLKLGNDIEKLEASLQQLAARYPNDRSYGLLHEQIKEIRRSWEEVKRVPERSRSPLRRKGPTRPRLQPPTELEKLRQQSQQNIQGQRQR